MSTRLLRRPEVEARTGLSRSSIYAWMSRGEFPRPLRIGQRAVAWTEEDIERWITTRKEANPHDIHVYQGGGRDATHVTDR